MKAWEKYLTGFIEKIKHVHGKEKEQALVYPLQAGLSISTEERLRSNAMNLKERCLQSDCKNENILFINYL